MVRILVSGNAEDVTQASLLHPPLSLLWSSPKITIVEKIFPNSTHSNIVIYLIETLFETYLILSINPFCDHKMNSFRLTFRRCCMAVHMTNLHRMPTTYARHIASPFAGLQRNHSQNERFWSHRAYKQPRGHSYGFQPCATWHAKHHHLHRLVLGVSMVYEHRTVVLSCCNWVNIVRMVVKLN